MNPIPVMAAVHLVAAVDAMRLANDFLCIALDALELESDPAQQAEALEGYEVLRRGRGSPLARAARRPCRWPAASAKLRRRARPTSRDMRKDSTASRACRALPSRCGSRARAWTRLST